MPSSQTIVKKFAFKSSSCEESLIKKLGKDLRAQANYGRTFFYSFSKENDGNLYLFVEFTDENNLQSEFSACCNVIDNSNCSFTKLDEIPITQLGVHTSGKCELSELVPNARDTTVRRTIPFFMR